MRIAVYGGTFNPIHNAHLHLMRSFAEAMQFDRIILMPSHTPPHKSGKALASPEDRLATVSYTHLDVYKRQAEQQAAREALELMGY